MTFFSFEWRYLGFESHMLLLSTLKLFNLSVTCNITHFLHVICYFFNTNIENHHIDTS